MKVCKHHTHFSKAKRSSFFRLDFLNFKLFVCCQMPSLGKRKEAKKLERPDWSAVQWPPAAVVALNSWPDAGVIGMRPHWGVASKTVCFIRIHFCKVFEIAISLIEISYVLLLRWWAEISFAFAKLNYFPKVFLNFHADATENSKRVKSC